MMHTSSRFLARLVGLVVAATLAVAATQLFAIGFETRPLFNDSSLTSIRSWITSRPAPATALLAGMAMAALAIAMFASISTGQTSPSVRIRRRDGWTRVDRASLADSLERRLESIDRRNSVTVTIGRRGTVDLDITTSDLSIDGPATELPAALAAICDERALPCRPGIVTLKPRTSAKRRHTVR